MAAFSSSFPNFRHHVVRSGKHNTSAFLGIVDRSRPSNMQPDFMTGLYCVFLGSALRCEPSMNVGSPWFCEIGMRGAHIRIRSVGCGIILSTLENGNRSRCSSTISGFFLLLPYRSQHRNICYLQVWAQSLTEGYHLLSQSPGQMPRILEFGAKSAAL